MSVDPPTLPLRYEPQALLGAGGGGAVFAVRDALTGEALALKVLAHGAGEEEYRALLREATFLAEAEGLGLPEVRAFGRTREGRAYLVRTMVAGAPLDGWSRGREPLAVASAVLSAMALVAVLHRFGLLHGDLKPANVVVDETGQGHLVDLGLAVPWSGEAAPARGFTPNYAAPELFEGAALDGRTEVFALAATLRDALANARPDEAVERALAPVLAAGLDPHPASRPAGVDEFAQRLRRALASLDARFTAARDRRDRWRLVGVEADAAVLGARLDVWPAGEVFWFGAERGSGVSTVARRWAWSAGVRGLGVELVDGARTARPHELVAEEALALVADSGFLVLDGFRLDDRAFEALALAGARRRVRLVVAGAWGARATLVPAPITREQGLELVGRMRPDLGDRAKAVLVERASDRKSVV